MRSREQMDAFVLRLPPSGHPCRTYSTRLHENAIRESLRMPEWDSGTSEGGVQKYLRLIAANVSFPRPVVSIADNGDWAEIAWIDGRHRANALLRSGATSVVCDMFKAHVAVARKHGMIAPESYCS